MFDEAEVILTYTRAQAFEDGVLIEVDPKICREASFKFPIAITHAVWVKCVEWTDEDNKRQTYQDIEGRLWDILIMLRNAIKPIEIRAPGEIITVRNPKDKMDENQKELCYEVWIVPRGGKARKPRATILKAVIGPGDNMEPVITIMFPNED